MHERIFEFWTGGQASGKTWQLRRRIAELSKKPSIRSVFICDRLGEYSDCGTLFVKFGDYLACEKIPRVCVFNFGINADLYRPIFREAIGNGNIVLVLDEAYDFAPAGSTWRGADDLLQIVLAGRHLRNYENTLCQVHLLVATQYPRQVHHSIWSQAATVCASKLTGDNAADWLRGNFGKEALLKNQGLGVHVFQVLRPENGKLPKN